MSKSVIPEVCIFWDNSNIFVPAQDVAKSIEGPTVGRDLRIQFDALFELARAGRKVVAGVCVGSRSSEVSALWDRLREVGIELELFERGESSHREQAVDQALQVHMLRTLVDRPPGVAVLLTGDGSGAREGKGFFADLRRMHARGWQVEVLSWRDSCHGGLRAWAEEHGHFVALDDFYEYITFVKGLRYAKRLPRQIRLERPKAVAVDAATALSASTAGPNVNQLDTEIERLRRDCCEAYQVIGAGMLCEPSKYTQQDVERALDNLNAAANGEPRPHEDLLPWPRPLAT